MDVAPQLRTALAEARARLSDNAAVAAKAQTNLGATASDTSMAALAQSAIFSEALMAALHSRLEEIKSVTK